jgi:hypothetical protein
VKPLHEYDLLEVVRMYHRASELGDRTIEFGPLAKFLPDEDDEDHEDQDEDHDEDEKEGADGGDAPEAGNGKPATVVQSGGDEATPRDGEA